jgi:hypothetical protein
MNWDPQQSVVTRLLTGQPQDKQAGSLLVLILMKSIVTQGQVGISSGGQDPVRLLDQDYQDKLHTGREQTQ